MAAARFSRPQYERSVFSYRGTSFLNLFTHEWKHSTTHRRALKPGFRLISEASSPRGRMWGMYPQSETSRSFPTYPASRQMFCSVPSAGRATRASSTLRISLLSWTFAPLTTRESGTPRSSTRACRLLPFFSPVRRVRPDGLPREGCLKVRPVRGLPFPPDPLELVVFRQPLPPERLEESGARPLPEAGVEGRRTQPAEFLARERVPDDPRP